MKRRSTMEEFDSLALDLDLAQAAGDSDALCSDLLPEALASFTDVDVELLRGSANLDAGHRHNQSQNQVHNLRQRQMVPSNGGKLVATQRRMPVATAIVGASLNGEEISYKVGATNTPMVSHSALSNASTSMATRSTPSRGNVLKVELPESSRGTTRSGHVLPSSLVSPVSSNSTVAVAASSSRGRRLREASFSSDGSSVSASISPTVSSRKGGSSKRRRSDSRQANADKGTDEYKRRRLRNNVAVRKSRDKAKQRQEETSKKVGDLAVENESLTRQLDSVRQELSLLRSIFSNLGIPIQQLVTDAMQSSGTTTSLNGTGSSNSNLRSSTRQSTGSHHK